MTLSSPTSRSSSFSTVIVAGLLALSACTHDRASDQVTDPGTSGTTPRITTGSIIGAVSADGVGLEGVMVRLKDDFASVTRLGGSFTFLNVQAGRYEVTIDAGPGYACSASTLTVTVIVGRESIVSFTCTKRPAALKGTVRLDEAPRSGLVVRLQENGQTTLTDASGQYSFADVTAGQYTVEVANPPHTRCRNAPRRLSLMPGGSFAADFSCTARLGALSVTVSGGMSSAFRLELTSDGSVPEMSPPGTGNPVNFTELVPGTYTIRTLLQGLAAAFYACEASAVAVMAEQIADAKVVCQRKIP